MNKQKKELTDWLYKWFDSKKIRSEEDLAKAIIQRYPQITKKPVKIEAFKDTGEAQLVCDYEIANELERYRSEHYVEVVE